MKRYIFLLISSFCFSLTFAQFGDLTKFTAMGNTGYNLTYILPKTSLNIDIQTTKVTQKAGRFYQYAEKYLGIRDVVTKDNEYWIFDKADIWGKGIPDADNKKNIQLRSNNNPHIYLTADGLLCSINTEPDVSLFAKNRLFIEKEEEHRSIDPISVLSEEFLLAGSTAKMAEIAAKQIYRIRESRLNILTGEAEKMPGDGESMKIVMSQLEEQEKALTEMFTGTTFYEHTMQSFVMIPEKDEENYVVCRFSKHLGIVDKNDLSGVPVYLSVKDTTNEQLFEDAEQSKGKNKNGIEYNLPGDARVTLSFELKSYFDESLKIVQFGTTALLPSSIFENKKNPQKALFYPDLGALKELIP